MDQIPQDPAVQERLAKLVSIFGGVAPGTPMEQVLQRLGMLQAVHSTTQSLYQSAIGALLAGLRPDTLEYVKKVDELNTIVVGWGKERGFNPMMPENIPHLEIAFAASVVQVVVEFIMAGGEQYVAYMNQAMRQIPAQFQGAGAQVDLEWFDPNTGEPQGSNNSEAGARAAAEMLARQQAAAAQAAVWAAQEAEVEAAQAATAAAREAAYERVNAVSTVTVPQQAPADSTIMVEGAANGQQGTDRHES